MVNDKISYCGNLVRAHDRDRFLLSLGAPRDKRAALWALFAFNHEIAKTREVVSDSTLGLIRLQWWHDALDNPPQGHEVVDALMSAIDRYDLPRADFKALIEARERDLDPAPLPDMGALVDYADRTATPLHRLALRVLGEDAEGAEAVSTAYALTGLIRALPVHGGAFLPHVPLDDIAGQAAACLEGAVPRGRFLRNMTRLTGLYINRLKRLDYNVHDPRLSLFPAGAAFRILTGI